MIEEKLINTYTGKIKEVTLGKDHVRVGGEDYLPFYYWEGSSSFKPLFGLEILDEEPQDWPEPLQKVYGEVWSDPIKWAQKCVEDGAEFILIWLTGTHPDNQKHTPQEAAAIVKEISSKIDLPLVVYGPGSKEKDHEVLRWIANEVTDQRLLLGPADEETYKLVVAPLIPTKHNVVSFSPVDVNIAKQVNILISQMGISTERIVMDPTTGALGYGLEYTFSIIERLRLAGLIQNDEMTSMPIICTIGRESWKTKEAKATTLEEPEWGDQEKRGIAWEVVTAITLMLAGANLLALRHPKSLDLLKKTREEFLSREGEGEQDGI